MADAPGIELLGDAAILVRLGEPATAELAARAQAIARAIREARPGVAGVGSPVPAGSSVLIPFDPLTIGLDALRTIAAEVVEGAVSGGAPPETGPEVELRVRYGGDDGPDLDAVAELRGLRPADVVELHAAARYRVLFLGFAPGFGYLGGLPDELVTPRRATPRERVPAGSVAIAGTQSAVYPRSMPGGWNLIGRTDAVLFDAGRPDPALLQPGATVRFVPERAP